MDGEFFNCILEKAGFSVYCHYNIKETLDLIR